MEKLSRFFTVLGLASVALAMFALIAPCTRGAEQQTDSWKQLFNGKDLDGWDTWLGRPFGGKEIVGLNKDPKKVYTVVLMDGKPAIRISGEIFGALTSKESFANYRLRLEFRWGDKKWPPRGKASDRRDSGLLYHCVGPHGAMGTFWMQSLECQIMEHDCGDFYSVAGPIVDVEGERTSPKDPPVYHKAGHKYTGIHSRIIREADYEKPVGQWNTMELLCVGDTSVHIVNGKANMVLTHIRHKVGAKVIPLTHGKIQLQSEGAEVFYRNIAIRPLDKIPDKYLK